jgi:hypothetical protein
MGRQIVRDVTIVTSGLMEGSRLHHAGIVIRVPKSLNNAMRAWPYEDVTEDKDVGCRFTFL